jgi:hypothetical protein
MVNGPENPSPAVLTKQAMAREALMLVSFR